MKRNDYMAKRQIFAAILAITAFLSSSCGKVKENQDATGEDVTLTFSTFYEEGVQADAYSKIIQAFEEQNDGIKVKLQAGASDYDNRIDNALKEGNGPDIIGLQRSKMLEYANQGKIMDITTWIQNQGLSQKYYGVNLGYGKYDGKYYGIGDMPYTVEWFYNVDLFKKAGISEPRDMDELINACSKLRKYVKYPIMLGAKDPWALNTFFGMITSQTIDIDELSKAYTNGDKEAFTSLKGADEAAEAFGRMVKSGTINTGTSDYDYASAVDAFVKGKAAILPMGSWAIDKIEKSKPKRFRYKTFDNPVLFTDSPHSEYSATAVQVITVNNKTKHKEEAMQFMNFLFSEEAQSIFKDTNGISGMKSVNSGSEEDISGQVIGHLKYTDENSNMYIDNVSQKMMNSTGRRLLQLIEGKLQSSKVWELIANES